MFRALLGGAAFAAWCFVPSGLASYFGPALEDWNQWQGPNRNNVSQESGLLDHWHENPSLIWKTEGIGIGYSSPTVANGIVCTMGDRNHQMEVVGLNAQDGKLLWRACLDQAMEGAYPGPRATPTLDGGYFYTLTPTGQLTCGELRTGKFLWDKYLKEDFDGTEPNFGFAESPLIDGDKLICTPGGKTAGMVALDKKTGLELWRCELGDDVCHSSIVISQGAGIRQYVQLLRSGLVSVDAQTGQQLWKHPHRDFQNITTPIIQGDYIFATNEGPGSCLIKLVRRGEEIDVEPIYVTDELKVHTGSVVLVEGAVYASVHDSICLDFLTGKTHWTSAAPGEGAANTSYADGHIYMYFPDGVMALVQATSEKYILKGKFQIPGAKNELAHPAISNGCLYVRQAEALYCYDLRAKEKQ